jgi:hypothetical protein
MLVKDSIAQWHLINMYPLLNSEFRLIVSSTDRLWERAYNENIESGIQYSGNSTLSYDRPVSLGKVMNEHAQV